MLEEVLVVNSESSPVFRQFHEPSRSCSKITGQRSAHVSSLGLVIQSRVFCGLRAAEEQQPAPARGGESESVEGRESRPQQAAQNSHPHSRHLQRRIKPAVGSNAASGEVAAEPRQQLHSRQQQQARKCPQCKRWGHTRDQCPRKSRPFSAQPVNWGHTQGWQWIPPGLRYPQLSPVTPLQAGPQLPPTW
ncbi:hypothetical protein O3P69_013385 [Scylla paramamosain]|uniref:CCHC-type domain-containing protein n=1 Tax=Scylla paramamosain TaxID=85552 RepID=A0AAW0U3B0_SCYPA